MPQMISPKSWVLCLISEAMSVFEILSVGIQQQLFIERDPHGNVHVSLIESEKLFSSLVATKFEGKPFKFFEVNSNTTYF